MGCDDSAVFRSTLFWMCLAAAALPACAQESLQFSGFALLRAATPSDGVPLEDDTVSAQVQLGIDWRPSLTFGGHVHLLARSESDGSHRGHAGVVEAWLEQNFVRGEHRLRLMEGAFFLPGSRENVDALWESPYSITSSALNSWMGEEFRPIGVDAAYTLRRRWTIGATAYRGNDTFGAFPVDRGWALRDQWALLGEHLRVDEEYFTSVSAETDGRIGWSARGRWNNERSTVQLTYIDNRSDAQEHGHLLNWLTRITIAGADYTLGDWTVAAESAFGTTTVFTFPSDIRASYVLVSRRLPSGRATLRVEEFMTDASKGHAITAAYFFAPRGKLRTGLEAIAAGPARRVTLEFRYSL
jgi:hypothetical protein